MRKRTNRTHNCAFRWRVSPWLVIAREDTEMASSHELFIIQSKNRVIRVQEVRMEDNLDTIVVSVEELHSPHLVQNRISAVVRHIVRRDWRERIALQCIDATF